MDPFIRGLMGITSFGIMAVILFGAAGLFPALQTPLAVSGGICFVISMAYALLS